MTFDHIVETSAPPEKIWAAWTDVDHWPQWDTELVSASLDGSFALGTRGRVKPKRGPAARISISELIRGESYTFTTRLPLCELKVRRHLTRKGWRRHVLHPRGVVRWATSIRVRQSPGPEIPGGVACGYGEPPKDRRELMSQGWAQLTSCVGTTGGPRATSLRPLWCLLWMRIRSNDDG